MSKNFFGGFFEPFPYWVFPIVANIIADFGVDKNKLPSG